MVDAGDDDGAVAAHAESESLLLPLAEADDARRRPEVARVEHGDGAEGGEQVLHLVPRQVRDRQRELQSNAQKKFYRVTQTVTGCRVN